MIQPTLILVGMAIAASAGALGYSYYKGGQACASAYEVKILKAKIKNQEIALAYYKSAKANADELSKQSSQREKAAKDRAEELQHTVDSLPVDNSVCVSAGFLRELSCIRQLSKRKTAGSTNECIPKGNKIPYKDLGPKGVQELLIKYAVNEDHNVRAIRTARRFHKQLQKIYNSKNLTTP